MSGFVWRGCPSKGEGRGGRGRDQTPGPSHQRLPLVSNDSSERNWMCLFESNQPLKSVQVLSTF